MGDQTSLVSTQEREANAKNQPMFRKRLFKDILIAISGSFRTGTSNTGCCMMSSPPAPLHINNGQIKEEGTVKHAGGQCPCDMWHTQSADRGVHRTGSYTRLREEQQQKQMRSYFALLSAVVLFLTLLIDINANVI